MAILSITEPLTKPIEIHYLAGSLWLPVEITDTIYWILYSVEIYTTTIFSLTHICFDSIIYYFEIKLCAQLEILNNRYTILFDNLRRRNNKKKYEKFFKIHDNFVKNINHYDCLFK